MITTLYTSCLSVTSSGGSLSPTESLSELLSLDYTSFSSSSQTIHREEYLHQVESWKKSIPDIRWSIQDLLIDGNKVAVRLIVSGSPKGDFMDLHDLDGGVSFAMMALSVHMIINNQIKCSYNLEDWESALSQIARVRLSELSVSAAYSFCL